jgi:hypothetical protein
MKDGDDLVLPDKIRVPRHFGEAFVRARTIAQENRAKRLSRENFQPVARLARDSPTAPLHKPAASHVRAEKISGRRKFMKKK